MSALEALSNKELRAKCMEYGMPNVPVTDSSRKVLIRRLDAVMSGKPLTPAKTNRRETMHVSKPSEIASSPKITINNNTSMKPPAANNRPSRRTIAATERHVATTTTVSEPEYSDVSPERVEVPVKLPTKAKTPEKPTLYPQLPAKEPSPKPQVLSKTGVVSTSYVQESNINLNKTYAAPEYIDSAEEEIQKEVRKPAVVISPLKTYVPISESKVSTSNPLSSTLSSSTRYSSLGSMASSYNYQKPSSYTTKLSNTRQTYAAPTTTTSYNQYNRTTARSYDDGYDIEDDFEDDEEDEDDEEVVVVEDSPVGKDIQTPFLSQFARNLETLKATPLRHSVGPTKITPPKSSSLRNRENTYSRRTIGVTGGTNIAPRRSLKDPQEDDSPFRQFVMSLEEKYHLKQTLFIISIFIIAVFIYVFFIQSV